MMNLFISSLSIPKSQSFLVCDGQNLLQLLDFVIGERKEIPVTVER
jgi:hypothetical protein